MKLVSTAMAKDKLKRKRAQKFFLHIEGLFKVKIC